MDTIIKIGELAPHFKLHDLGGKEHTLEGYAGMDRSVEFLVS